MQDIVVVCKRISVDDCFKTEVQHALFGAIYSLVPLNITLIPHSGKRIAIRVAGLLGHNSNTHIPRIAVAEKIFGEDAHNVIAGRERGRVPVIF